MAALDGTGGRRVVEPDAPGELEAGRGEGFQLGRPVAAHRQATAALGPVGREGGDERVATRYDGGLQNSTVGRAVGLVGEEVQDDAVVP